MPRVTVRVGDFINREGLWVRTSTQYGVEVGTRAHEVWSRLESRCNAESVSVRRPTYNNVRNGFASFQAFAEWAQGQYGYMLKDETGKYWQLDKDILLSGNLVYSEETCVFVPQRLNTILSVGNSRCNGLPLGVTWHKMVELYVAQMSNPNSPYAVGKKHLGSFKCQMEAHRAWQVARSSSWSSSARIKSYRIMQYKP